MVVKIGSLEDSRIQPYRTLRSLPTGGSGEYCVAEGEKGVQALLQSSWVIQSFLAEESYHPKYAELLVKRGLDEASIWTASRDLMEQIVGYRMHQGIMALAEAPAWAPLDEFGSRVVAMDTLANAENVGAIVRNAVAFGVRDLLIDGECSSPYLRRSIKVSMGAIYSARVGRVERLVEGLESLRERGYRVVGAHLGEGSVSLNSFDWPEKHVLVVGSEGHGLREEVVCVCDDLVQIPMCAPVDSLNVAAATAVMLYAAV